MTSSARASNGSGNVRPSVTRGKRATDMKARNFGSLRQSRPSERVGEITEVCLAMEHYHVVKARKPEDRIVLAHSRHEPLCLPKPPREGVAGSSGAQGRLVVRPHEY